MAEMPRYKRRVCQARDDVIFAARADVAQLVEQRFRNSRESFCAGLRAFAKRYPTRTNIGRRMHFFCVQLRCLASKIYVTVENDREKSGADTYEVRPPADDCGTRFSLRCIAPAVYEAKRN